MSRPELIKLLKKKHPKLNKTVTTLFQECNDDSVLDKQPKWLKNPSLQFNFKTFNYLAIEGNIGAGKTSLATKIKLYAEANSKVADFSPTGNVEVNDITDHYKVIIDQQPYNVEVCRNVPVAGDKTADALTGAIIGGIIGNNIKGEKNGGRWRLL